MHVYEYVETHVGVLHQHVSVTLVTFIMGFVKGIPLVCK